MKQVLITLSIILTSCSYSDHASSVSIGALPEDDMSFQKMIVAQLTGKQKIETKDGKKLRLKSRWSVKERNISLDYFESLFNQLDLKTYRHHYEMPNSNPAVDLLIEPLQGSNIYTILPSITKSNEYVVIGAHYDTDGENFPGAIDNGSGIALISSVLRQARDLTIRDRNLIVVYFDQEEEGISAGSLAFAKYLKTHNYNIHSAHSFDLIGWDGDNNKEVQLAFPMPNPKIENIYKKIASELKIPIYSIESNASDYSSFYKMGINTIGISQAYAKGDLSGKKDSPHDQYHLVDFDYLASSTNLAFKVIKDLLNDPSTHEQ